MSARQREIPYLFLLVSLKVLFSLHWEQASRRKALTWLL
jgi:hypothetical protein